MYSIQEGDIFHLAKIYLSDRVPLRYAGTEEWWMEELVFGSFCKFRKFNRLSKHNRFSNFSKFN